MYILTKPKGIIHIPHNFHPSSTIRFISRTSRWRKPWTRISCL
jgi:hypothetical protein